jgi:flagellar biosynthesis regulator FlaF
MPHPVNESGNLATRKVLEERLNDAGYRVRTFLHNKDDMLWKKKQPEFYGADLLKSIDFSTLIWYVMVTAKHIDKCGIPMEFVTIVRNMRI